MSGQRELDAGYFDGWYANMVASSAVDQISQRHLGLPPELLSTSLLDWHGLVEVVEALELSPGDTFVDLACGRGGYGFEVAARTKARHIGIDFSPEAIRQAKEQAAARGADSDFRVGDLAATGLPDDSVDAVLCVDAIQFAADTASAVAELRRVLVPAGRLVLTCWEPVQLGDPEVSERLRHLDLGSSLRAGGFEKVRVQDKPDWRARERGMWEEAAAVDPAGDPALQSFHDEGVQALTRFEALRRVLVTATAPS